MLSINFPKSEGTMSHNEFILALTLFAKAIPLRVLIMAAILSSNKVDEKILKNAFPEIWQEVRKRSHLLDRDNDDET